MTLAPDVISPPREIRFDDGPHPRAKLGFVLLASEQAGQDELQRLMPAGVGCHFTRIANPDVITRATLGALGPELSRAAATLLPDIGCDVVSYHCTSGSLVLGETRVAELLAEGQPGARPTCIIASVCAALRALAVRRIVVATPYLDEVNTAERDYLAASGFDVLEIQGLNLTRDSDMARVTPDYLADFAADLDRAEAEAIFISCGALRTTPIIAALEARTGKPVVTSNQAAAWQCLRLAGIADPVEGFGTLFSAH